MRKGMYTEAQKEEILNKYVDEMEIIKYRTEQILSADNRFGYKEPAVEFKALQLRKIIEQIFLASLVANAEEYKAYHERLGKEWNARLICQDLERINPDFFPKPVTNGTDYHIENKDGGITSQELIKVYDKLGKYLHSKNPYDENKWDYDAISEYIDLYTKRIIYTLNSHNVTLLGGEVFLNVVMKRKDDGRAYVLWAELCDEEEQQRAEQIIRDQIEKDKCKNQN